ncbi:MAG: GNAT family N-acetyltransferase [Planctomycetaceae bacterium]
MSSSASSQSPPKAIEPYNSIFQRPWWLDAVAPGQWKALEVNRGGQLVARMPIAVERKLGQTLIAKPRLTQTLGPWLLPTDVKQSTRLTQEKEWMTELIDQLPPFSYFCQNFDYSVQNWYPFYLRGFEATVFYTYVIEDLSDMDKVVSGYDSKTRNTIRKGRNEISVRSDLGVEVLWDMTCKSFACSGNVPPYSFEFLARLHAACEANNACKLFFSEDSDGNVHGGLLVVHDEMSAYYLVGGSDPKFRQSAGYSLLVHEAIEYASTVSKVFNFEGSMVEPIERFMRGFGGTQKPIITVRGYSRMMRLYRHLREAGRRAAG